MLLFQGKWAACGGHLMLPFQGNGVACGGTLDVALQGKGLPAADTDVALSRQVVAPAAGHPMLPFQGSVGLPAAAHSMPCPFKASGAACDGDTPDAGPFQGRLCGGLLLMLPFQGMWAACGGTLDVAAKLRLRERDISSSKAEAHNVVVNSSAGRARFLQSPASPDEWYAEYQPYDAILQRAQELANELPDLVTSAELATRSVENRPIALLRITGPSQLAADSRPKLRLLLLGAQHGREWISAMVPMFVAEYLARQYATAAPVKWLLDRVEVMVVPVVNPDGYVFTRAPETGRPCTAYLSGLGECDRLWRKNRSPSPPMSGYAQRNCVGVDLNRNWGLDWGPRGGESVSDHPCGKTYSGESSFSAPETLAVKQLVEAEDGGVFALVDFHCYFQAVLSPWHHTNVLPVHALILDEVGQRFARTMSMSGIDYAFSRGDLGGDLYLASGTAGDWAYGAHQMLSFTVELPPMSAIPGFLLEPEHIAPTGLDALRGIVDLGSQLPGLVNWTAQTNVSAPSRCVNFWSLLLDMQYDLYPDELTWSVTREVNGQSVAPAGSNPYLYHLCHLGVYVFSIRDAWGDGVCCQHGIGSFMLHLD
ncbi:hypothetical protein CYMTET_29239, partial [Cymbomonas tetramitiformis]